MWLLFLLSLIPPAGAFAADRIGWLKKRPWAQGVLFGLLCLIVHILLQKVQNPSDYYGVLDALILIPGFFFGPVAVCIAGAAASAVYVIGRDMFWLGGLGVFVADTVYSILSSKYFFYGRRPPVVLTVLFFAFAELFCTIIFFLVEFNQRDLALETTVVSVFPMLLEVTISGTLTAIVCRSAGNWKSNLLNYKVLAAFLFNAVCVSLFFMSVWNARDKSAQRLIQGMQEIHRNFTSQVRYMLRRSVYRFLYGMRDVRRYSSGDLQKLASENCMDEINIMDKDGLILSSSNPENVKKDRPVRKHFTVAKEMPGSRFLMAEDGFIAQYNVKKNDRYSVIMPFCDGSGYLEASVKKNRMFTEHDLLAFPLLKDRRIGNSGFAMAVDPNGTIDLSSQEQTFPSGKTIFDFGASADCLHSRELVPFLMKFKDRWYVSMRRTTYGRRNFFVMLPLAEVSSGQMVLPCVCILFLCAFVFGIRIMWVRLNQSDEKVKVLQRERYKRHKQELELARRIQSAELRYDHPETEHCKVDSFVKPMEEVGGDFYDYYFLPDGRLVGTIADVSGDGVPGAIFMMKAKTTLREQILSCTTLEEAVTCANERLCLNNDAKMFVTAWIGVLYPDSGRCDYICAGHNPPIWRHGGKVEWLPGTGSQALAVTPGAKFRMKSFQLRCGDGLFLYTDGVTEARNAKGEMFTEKRLLEVLAAEHDMYIGPVRAVLEQFVEKAQQFDDITMLEMKYKGSDEELRAAGVTVAAGVRRTVADTGTFCVDI